MNNSTPPLVSPACNAPLEAAPPAIVHSEVIRMVASAHLALMEAHGIGLRQAHKLHTEARFFGWPYSLPTIQRGIARLRAERLALLVSVDVDRTPGVHGGSR
jgi:hypothetical protein